MNLVGLIGNAGSGKNSFAEEFHYHKFTEYSFAHALKQTCEALFGFSDFHFTSRDYKDSDHPYWKISPRQALQFVGTELVRERMNRLLPELGENFWIHRLELQLMLDHKSRGDVRAVVTDCRFQNEVDWILSQGGTIIHLTRPEAGGNVGIPDHKSELLAANFRTHYPESDKILYVDNVGTLDELKIKANIIAAKLTKSLTF